MLLVLVLELLLDEPIPPIPPAPPIPPPPIPLPPIPPVPPVSPLLDDELEALDELDELEPLVIVPGFSSTSPHARNAVLVRVAPSHTNICLFIVIVAGTFPRRMRTSSPDVSTSISIHITWHRG